MAAAKANFAALAKLVADVLVSDDDDREMSDLQSEEELEETSDLAVAAVLVAQIIREDRHRTWLYVESVVDSYSDEEFRRLFRLPRCTTEVITDDFESSSHYPRDVIGAIDGCHVRITRPTECEEDYYSRKKFHYIILQAVCDADMVFTDVFVGFPGRAHDARVLEESFLFEEAASRFDGGYVLGNAAYPLLPWLLLPYRHVTSSWQPWMSKFNHVHSKQRVAIEIAFGLLKGRFRRLDKVDVNSIPQAVEIVMAACVLHNLARRHADVFEHSDIANSDLGIFSSEPVDVDHKPTSAARLRDRLAQSVPL
ncbi:hypothetical protein MRX96_037386 [Rhipicephalus microplus]